MSGRHHQRSALINFCSSLAPLGQTWWHQCYMYPIIGIYLRPCRRWMWPNCMLKVFLWLFQSVLFIIVATLCIVPNHVLVDRYFLGIEPADWTALSKKHQHTCLKSKSRHGPRRGLNPWPPDDQYIALPTKLPVPSHNSFMIYQ